MDEGLKRILDSFWDVVELYWHALSKPYQTVDRLVRESGRPAAALMLKLWLLALLAAYAFRLPIYHKVGIEWGELGFHLPVFLFQTFTIFVSILSTYIALLLLRVKVPFRDVAAVESVTAAPYEVPRVFLNSGDVDFVLKYLKSKGALPPPLPVDPAGDSAQGSLSWLREYISANGNLATYVRFDVIEDILGCFVGVLLIGGLCRVVGSRRANILTGFVVSNAFSELAVMAIEPWYEAVLFSFVPEE